MSIMKEKKITNPLVIVGSGGIERHKDFFLTVLGKTSMPHYRVKGEPTVEDAIEAVKTAINNKCDSVLSVGGGSSIDLGKAVSALITNNDDVYNYLEVVGKGKPITNPPVPFIALPTTSGTGSEVTKNAVLKSVQHGRKVSIRHDWLIPTAAIIDPTLTVTCPPTLTAHVGLDTLCQVIEPYTSNAANPIVDALAKEGIVRAARSLRTVVANGQDIQAREDLAVASVLGGLSLANAKLGVVHGFASVLGGMYETAPHGAICAALLPHAFKMNVEKLIKGQETGDKDAGVRLARFVEVARLCTGNGNATALDGVKWLAALNRDLAIPSLLVLCKGMKMDDIPTIIQGTAEASSTKGNPVVLSVSELEELLRKAM